MIHIDIKKKLHGTNGLMDLDVNFGIKEGQFLAISGLSGSGKTTLLRVLAGLEESSGEIKVGEEVWQGEDTMLRVQERGIGFVFQDYALFENMSVQKNLLYVNKDKKLASKLLELTELTQLRKRKPSTLSGGQKQRVSLCRAMMNRPKLLLMDEPLSALDPTMRRKLQNEILALHKEFGTTTIMVSHDPAEIYKLAQRVIVLENGKIISDGNPQDALVKRVGSQKFSFEGEVIDITQVDVIWIALIAIGQQLVEVVLSADERKELNVGKKVKVGTKAFSPIIKYNIKKVKK
ncbi:MAG: molybdate transport system ATP-binding protein [Sulfurimonas sp.]|jgi:molybdate transport system ATP-binding protein|uniref:ABC transporter ATP-binding protein n=1 Tax=Sulfurimonas sp. TaxID=2022749 RepID=UPI0039E65887